MEPKAEILVGNSLEVLRTLETATIDVVVTSPPYFGLRDYKTEQYVWPAVSYAPMPGLPELSFPCDPECDHEWGDNIIKRGRSTLNKDFNERWHGEGTAGLRKQEQSQTPKFDGGAFCQKCGAWRGALGQEPTPQMYVAHLVLICREIRRVLKKSGTFWLNLGDSSVGSASNYDKYGSNGKNSRTVSQEGRIGVLPTSGRKERTKAVRASGLKPKDIVGIPWQVAFALQADGWWLRQDNIWHKPNVLPRSVTDNTTLDYEHVFMFSKNQKYWFDQDAIREPLAPASLPRAGRKKKLIEKTGLGTIGKQVRNEVDDSHGYAGLALGRNGKTGYDEKGRNKRTVWTVTTKASNWEFCKACSTLYIGLERRRIRKEDYVENGTKRRRQYCPCGAHDQWEAHFATYPIELAEVPVKAGISPGGACVDCGKPYRRVTLRTTEFGGGSGRAGRTPEEVNHVGKWANQQYGKNLKLGPVLKVETLGFEPDCGCGAPSEPCVVLDPFAGSGTTGIVALREGASFVGIELNPTYAEIARQRIEKETRTERSLFDEGTR